MAVEKNGDRYSMLRISQAAIWRCTLHLKVGSLAPILGVECLTRAVQVQPLALSKQIWARDESLVPGCDRPTPSLHDACVTAVHKYFSDSPVAPVAPVV